MLKARIITTMLWNGSTLVKGNKFENEKRSAGSPLTTVKIYNSRDVDEILFFDIIFVIAERTPFLSRASSLI